MSLLTILIVLALMATVYSLIRGLTAMSVNGQAGERSSNQWMMRRVGFQALAVVLLLAALWLGT